MGVHATWDHMGTVVIKNLNELATTSLRRDALAILQAGYDAVQTEQVIRDEVEVHGNDICIKGQNICLSNFERVFYVAVGKCAVDASHVLEELLGERIADGIVLDVKHDVFRRFRSLVGTHPFPSDQNVDHTKEIVSILSGATERDLVITAISGGGSSLLCLPHSVQCNEVSMILEALWQKGATIGEVNTVRKHLSEIQGGQLAKIAYPATVLSLIFSDVPGNDLGVIASGPTVRDETTVDDAAEILARYDVLTMCALPDCQLIETPKEEIYFERVFNKLLVTNDRALAGMKEKAESLGYNAEIKMSALQGNATLLGAEVARYDLPPRTCLLYGGETTVEVKGKGKGGRNQEFALSAVPVIPHKRVLVAAASDGWDNSDSAGAICDAGDRERAQQHNIFPENYLKDNSSYFFWETIGGGIITGRTGINVADFYFLLSE